MMSKTKNTWMLLVLLISLFLSLRNPVGETENPFNLSSSSSSSSSSPIDDSSRRLSPLRGVLLEDKATLKYDFYGDTCPRAENIIRSTMQEIFSEHNDTSAALLRLFFHDCFIQGCDASVLLDDSNGNKNHSIERQAIPNRTLKGFDKIDIIKEQLEKACPGVVSCADILALATRDGIVLAGGPFYPVFTGRRDSTESFYEEALAEIPRPNDTVNQTLHLFALRGFNPRETVALLGGHNIGKIGCEFIQNRLYNFSGTGQPDPTISPDALNEMRLNCRESNSSSNDRSLVAMRSRGMGEFISYYQRLSSSLSSGAGFDTHYYESLLNGRGILFADQQLMVEEKTARVVRAYASDDGSTFRADFARVMVKMSTLSVLTGSQGQVRLNCSMPVSS